MNAIRMYITWLDSIKDGPDQTARDRLAAHLVECEQAKTILRHKGYGISGTSIVDAAKAVPENR